jgi:hypothetical protein
MIGMERLEHPVPTAYTWFFCGRGRYDRNATSENGHGVSQSRLLSSSDDKVRPGLNLEFDRFVKGQKKLAGSE